MKKIVVIIYMLFFTSLATTTPHKKQRKTITSEATRIIINQQKKAFQQKTYDDARANNKTEVQAAKIAKHAGDLFYKKLYRDTPEYKQNACKYRQRYKQKSTVATKKLTITFPSKKLKSSPSQSSSASQKIHIIKDFASHRSDQEDRDSIEAEHNSIPLHLQFPEFFQGDKNLELFMQLQDIDPATLKKLIP